MSGSWSGRFTVLAGSGLLASQVAEDTISVVTAGNPIFSSVLLIAPNGTIYQVAVTNEGALTTTLVP